jgi:hypothetical protein
VIFRHGFDHAGIMQPRRYPVLEIDDLRTIQAGCRLPDQGFVFLTKVHRFSFMVRCANIRALAKVVHLSDYPAAKNEGEARVGSAPPNVLFRCVKSSRCGFDRAMFGAVRDRNTFNTWDKLRSRHRLVLLCQRSNSKKVTLHQTAILTSQRRRHGQARSA